MKRCSPSANHDGKEYGEAEDDETDDGGPASQAVGRYSMQNWS